MSALATTRDRVRLALAARPLPWWTAAFVLALLASAATAVSLGSTPIPAGDLASALVDGSHPLHTVVWDLRIPRVLAGGLVGAALALSGALLQTAARNPLADPGLLGVNAGAGVAALAAILFFPEHGAWVPLCAFAGALVAVFVALVAASTGATRIDPLRLVLAGVAVQALLFAGMAILTFVYADRAPSFASFTLGSLNGRGGPDLLAALPAALVGAVLAFALVRPLDLLLLDDASATSAGLRVRGARVAAAAVSALLAASAVSIAGLVGFVGLVAPNAVRLAVGPEHRPLLPLTALAGATLVVLADTAARTLAAPVELPVGALLAAIGAPALVALASRRLA